MTTGPGDWATDAIARLANLGFLVVHGDRPEAAGGPRLLVALRDHPAYTHFDPEAIGYWRIERTPGLGRGSVRICEG